MEISREKLSAKLDTIPEADREPYLAALKAKGYTWNVGKVKDAVAQPSETDSGTRISPARALLTNEPTQGLAEDLLRGVPAGLGGAFGGGAGLVGGIPSGPGAVLTSMGGAAAGSAGGEAARQAAANLYARATGKTPTPIAEAAKGVAVQGAVGGLGQGVGLAAGPVLKYAGKKVGDLAEYTAKNLAGVAKQSYDFAKGNISSVVKYVGANPEQANALAGELRSSIDDAAKAGEAYYRTVVDKIIGDGTNVSGVKINARKSLAQSVESVRKQFGYDAPVAAPHAHGSPTAKPLEILSEFGGVASRIKPEAAAVKGTVRVTSPDEAAAFSKFADAIGKMKEASPQQVYFLQKDLNGAIENAYGTPLGAALKQLRSSVRKMVDDNAKDLPDLIDANKAYAAAQDLRETAKNLVNSNDLVGEIRRIFSNEFATGKKAAIEEIAARVPKVGETVNNLRGFNAAASFDPYFRTLPQTGMGFGVAGAAGAAGAAAVNNPLTALLSVPAMAMASPRAQLMALRLGIGAGNMAGRIPANAARYFAAPAAGAGGSVIQELLRTSPTPQGPQLSPAMQEVLRAAAYRR